MLALNILKTINIVALLALYFVSAIKFVHYFQLNSYQFKSHFLWMKRNVKKQIANVVSGLIVLLLLCQKNILFYILAFVAQVLSVYFIKPQKAKKPLVYTMRIKRFLTVHTLLFVVALLIGTVFNNALVFSAIMYMLSPFVIVVTALICAPIENGVKNHYINDAKKLLASAQNLKIIGITGSYGKTSLKYYLSSLLKAKYNVLMTPESFNTPMGVVRTIRENLNASHEYFVCEMGARHVGDIKEICDIVHPENGVITSIGPQHLETFKSLDNIIKTKFELADCVNGRGYLFLNTENENIENSADGYNYISYSITKDSDYKAYNIKADDKGTSFDVKAPNGESCTYVTALVGEHNVLNVLGAIAIANTFGIELESLKIPVKKLKSVPHRLELKDMGTHCIIDDAYNSNPSGSKAALDALNLFDGFKIIVTPGMVELGDKMEELNSIFGEQCAKVCDYVVLVGEAQARDILKGLRKHGYPEDKIYVAKNVTEGINKAYSIHSGNLKKYILLENDLTDNYLS